jgi:hypothetical protein
MRQSTALLTGTLLFCLTMNALPQDTTVSGTLVDLACYTQNKDNSGNHHVRMGYTCAQACAREGFEVGLLTTDGKVYHLRGAVTAHSNARLVPYMASAVWISGHVSELGGQMYLTSDTVRPEQHP